MPVDADGSKSLLAAGCRLQDHCILTATLLPTLLPHPQGQYPVIREDAAQMCALQMQAEYGPTLASDSASFEQALEKYMVKQVGPVLGGACWSGMSGLQCGGCCWRGQPGWLGAEVAEATCHPPSLTLRSHPPPPPAAQILTSRPRQEWLADVAARYRALSQFSKDDARIQYLRIIRSLPYGNSIFFTVKVHQARVARDVEVLGVVAVGMQEDGGIQEGFRIPLLLHLSPACIFLRPAFLPNPANSASRTPSACCPPS